MPYHLCFCGDNPSASHTHWIDFVVVILRAATMLWLVPLLLFLLHLLHRHRPHPQPHQHHHRHRQSTATVNQSNPEARQDQQCSIACRGGPGEHDAELRHGFFLRQHGFLGHSFRVRAWGLGFRASGGAESSIRVWSVCGTSASCW